MLLKEVSTLSTNEVITPLSELSIWHQDVESISNLEMRLTLTLLTNKCGTEQAKQIINIVQGEVLMLIILDELEECSLVDFRLPEKPFYLNDLIEVLAAFDEIERKAILVALFQQVELTEVVGMSRKELMANIPELNFMQELVGSILPNLRTKYAFWRIDNFNQVAPLLDLPGKFIRSTGVTWEEFVRRLDCVYIDQPEFSESVQKIINA